MRCACDATEAEARFSRQKAVRIGKKMHNNQTTSSGKAMLEDNGGRRLGGDRRIYTYNDHIPERRSGKERRSGLDRRKKTRFS